MFLRNYWYVAASDSEVGRQPLRRIILGEPIVFFRTEDGKPVAFEDRCAHRHLPLSMGKLVGDHLQCHYHGLRFDQTGQCVRIPGQDQIPPAAKVKTYPVIARRTWIWVWMGDPALADPDKITDFHWLDDPNWGAKSSYLHVKANWQLVVDNLLDLTHLAFVHDTTSAIRRSPNVRYAANVVVRWLSISPRRDIREGRRLWLMSTAGRSSTAPPAFHGSTSVLPQPAPGARGTRVDGITMRNLNAITPETETTSHYFWGQAHDFDVRNADLTQKIFEQIETAFLEDVGVFSAQQHNLNIYSNPPQIDINADIGVLQARRIIDRLRSEEQAALQMTAAE